MSVRGIGWYGAAFVALIVSIAFIGIAGASFFASLTPLYVSIACSIVAVVFAVVAAVRARPGTGTPPADEAQPAEAAAPSDAVQPGESS